MAAAADPHHDAERPDAPRRCAGWDPELLRTAVPAVAPGQTQHGVPVATHELGGTTGVTQLLCSTRLPIPLSVYRRQIGHPPHYGLHTAMVQNGGRFLAHSPKTCVHTQQSSEHGCASNVHFSAI